MISRYWKAVIAFASILSTALAAISVDSSIHGALPTAAQAWIVTAGTLLGTGIVWLKRNEPTVEEAEKLLDDARKRLGG